MELTAVDAVLLSIRLNVEDLVEARVRITNSGSAAESRHLHFMGTMIGTQSRSQPALIGAIDISLQPGECRELAIALDLEQLKNRGEEAERSTDLAGTALVDMAIGDGPVLYRGLVTPPVNDESTSAARADRQNSILEDS